MRLSDVLLVLAVVGPWVPARAARAAELAFRPQEIGAGLGVGYAVMAVDMNADRKLDVVVVDTGRVIWYENPTWELHTIIEGQTKKDNVCIAPYDIDGDGRLDFALGADWHPAETHAGGTIQWLAQPTAPDVERWNVFAIAEEPTMHRMRWADLDGDGRAELIAVPLQGAIPRGPTGTATACASWPSGFRPTRVATPGPSRC